MDIPKTTEVPNFTKVYSQRLNTWWEVINGPQESSINGLFRGEQTPNNPPAWVFGLRLLTTSLVTT